MLTSSDVLWIIVGFIIIDWWLTSDPYYSDHHWAVHSNQLY